MSDLPDLSLIEVASMVQRRAISPREVATAILERIDALDPTIHAFIYRTDRLLLTLAQLAEVEIDAGRYLGPLHGTPLAVKDIFDVERQPTTAGSSFLCEEARADSTAWARLREGGALLVGKTNLHEFCYGPTTVNPHHGTTRNPWNVDHIAGGSSGGSAAAVAAGMAYGALGSDTGGSTRLPAAFTGVVGFKPTRDRISREGMFPLSDTFDHASIFTRRARDAQVMWWALTKGPQKNGQKMVLGVDNHFKGLRVGVLSDHLALAHPAVRQRVQEAIDHIAALQAEIVEISLPEEEEAVSAASVMVAAEAAHVHQPWLHNENYVYGDDVRQALRRGETLTAVDYLSARQTYVSMAQALLQRQQAVDIVVGPTVVMTAPKVDEAAEPRFRQQLLRCTYVFNVTGQPALSIPCGVGADGLPVGLQIAAKPGQDALVLATAMTYEGTDGPGLPHRPPL